MKTNESINSIIKKISKEKSDLIKKLTLEKNPNPYIEAGFIINKKYGKGWREKLEIQDKSYKVGRISYYK